MPFMSTRSIAAKPASAVCSISTGCGAEHNRVIGWLQGITIAWMLVECAVALTAAVRAHSPVLLAFGADSLVELLSATVVLLQFTPKFRIQSDQASRIAGILLFVLAGFVVLTSVGSLALAR